MKDSATENEQQTSAAPSGTTIKLQQVSQLSVGQPDCTESKSAVSVPFFGSSTDGIGGGQSAGGSNRQQTN